MKATIPKGRLLLSVILFAFASLLILRPPVEFYPINQSMASIHLLLALTAVVSHYFINSVDRNFARYDILFLLGMLIVNFQWIAILILQNIHPEDVSRYFSGAQFMNFSVWLSAIAMTSWIFGYNVLYRQRLKRVINIKLLLSAFPRSDRIRNMAGLAVAISYGLFIVFAFLVGAEFRSGVYRGTENWGAGATYVYLILHVFIILSTTLTFVIYADRRYQSHMRFLRDLPKSYVFLILLYVIAFLWVGDRGGPIEIATIAGILYGMLIKPVRATRFLPVLVIAALVVMVIGLGRNKDGNILLAGVQELSVESIFDLTAELATSQRTMLTAVKVVEADGITYGKLMLSNILSVVPFGQTIYLSSTGDSVADISSSSFLTLYIKGTMDYGGTGTSYIADIYLNFATFGIVILPFLHGFVLAKMMNAVLRMRSMMLLSIFAAFASLAVIVARGSYLGFVKPCIWIAICYFTLSVIQQVLVGKRRS